MENKYFIPDIEDLHIGYDCEIYNQYSSKLIKKVEWHPVKVNCSPEMSKYVGILQCKKLIKTQHIRVPYLTKEQIEAEGWIYEKEVKTVKCYDKENIFLACSEKTHRMLIRKHENETWKTIYFGRCKDINTFKKLTKLLEI